MPKSLAKHVLRQRIYSCCLDFFCNDKMYPNRSGPALVEDVQVAKCSLQKRIILYALFLGHAEILVFDNQRQKLYQESSLWR